MIKRFWWVNQNQTYKQEVEGGYLWSPKRNANGARNPFYEQMREVSPGDLILSFQGTYIRAVGVARSFAYECPKPTEFLNTGSNWGAVGWRVDVSYTPLEKQIRPADHMEKLNKLLPAKYSPLQATGRGLQGVYLTSLSEDLFIGLAALVGPELLQLANDSVEEVEVPFRESVDGLFDWEERLQQRIEDDESLEQTEREQLVMARRGQGRFKANVRLLESDCRLTKVDQIEHLRASHIKPWRDCDTSDARLDGENGLLLTPTMDHLFDRGFLSFEDGGELLLSPVANQLSLERMGVPTEGTHCGGFSEGQRAYLEFHREFVFLRSSVKIL